MLSSGGNQRVESYQSVGVKIGDIGGGDMGARRTYVGVSTLAIVNGTGQVKLMATLKGGHVGTNVSRFLYFKVT